MVNNHSKYLWDTFNGNEYDFVDENSAKSTMFISNYPIWLSFIKTDNVEVNISLSLYGKDGYFQKINTNEIIIYGRTISMQVYGRGVLFINKIQGPTDWTDDFISPTKRKVNNFQPTKDDCIFLKPGLTHIKITMNTLIVIPEGCVSYFYANGVLKEANVTNQKMINISDDDSLELDCITVNKDSSAIVTNKPDIFVKRKTILFVSNTSTSSSRSLKYYSSSKANISTIPPQIKRNDHKIDRALAVLIEEPEETVIGFYESEGYNGEQTISIVENQSIISSIDISDNQYMKADSQITYIIFPKTDKMNILLKGKDDKHELSVINQVKHITLSQNESCSIVLLDPKVDHVSALLNPKQYTRKTVMPGNCAIILDGSKPIQFNPVYGLKSADLSANLKLLTGNISSEAFIDFTGESDNTTEEIVLNLKNAEALRHYDPKWNATSNYDGQILTAGRYDIQLTSKIQTVTVESSSIAFFVPKSINDSIKIDVINPVSKSRDVRKFDIFAAKLLGYYFASTLKVELSGNSSIEVYVYNISAQPNMSTVTFNRGGKIMESKGTSFVGFSNYELCIINEAEGVSIMQNNNIGTVTNFTGDPFIIQNKGTVKYTLISMKPENDNYIDNLFTIPINQDGIEISVVSSQDYKDMGILVPYKSGLSGGAIAGIVIAVIILCIIIAAAVFLILYWRKQESKTLENDKEEEDLPEGNNEAEPNVENEEDIVNEFPV